jgi:hypothetical protein
VACRAFIRGWAWIAKKVFGCFHLYTAMKNMTTTTAMTGRNLEGCRASAIGCRDPSALPPPVAPAPPPPRDAARFSNIFVSLHAKTKSADTPSTLRAAAPISFSLSLVSFTVQTGDGRCVFRALLRRPSREWVRGVGGALCATDETPTQPSCSCNRKSCGCGAETPSPRARAIIPQNLPENLFPHSRVQPQNFALTFPQGHIHPGTCRDATMSASKLA